MMDFTGSRPTFRRVIFFILLDLIALPLFAQKFTISGTVEDGSSGERLINANIYDPAAFLGVISNNYGFYSITMPAGTVKLVCSYVGFKPLDIRLDLRRDTVINLKLEPVTSLAEVTIRADRASPAVRSTQMSMTELSGQSIEKIPALLGEVDVLKALQLLPGVQSGTEGSSGIYVRGGGPDQNLILLDGVPVYNVNHLFGFFSVFNSDAIQTVKLIKGGFPARYGGRLSSVLDIRMKDGNNKKFGVEGSVGLIASRITVEGPIIKDKTSFIVSGRRTYIDLLARPLIRYAANRSGQTGTMGGYYFYDFNAKVNHRFSDRSRLFLSAYAGRDKAYINFRESIEDRATRQDFGLGWGNITTALRWNYVISPKLFSNTTLTYSKYDFLTSMAATETMADTLRSRYMFSYDSGIRDLAGRIDFDWQPGPGHAVKFGYSHTFHQFRPGVTVYQMKEGDQVAPIDTSFGNRNINAPEIDAYLEDDWQIGTRLKVNAGLHGSAFMVQDSTYASLQPRLSAMFMINENWSIKAAYTHMTQHIHLLSNSTIGLPTDLWVPSTALIRPQKSIQYALGTVYEFKQGFELSVEGYYKSMDNLIEYKEGSSFFTLNTDWQDKLEFGRGVAYGGEFLIRKTTGKTTGWVGYTLSWTKRKFDNISFGEWFPYRYDRRHDISVVVSHQFSQRFDIGATWVYGSGNAVTLPVTMYTRNIWPDLIQYPQYVMAFEGRNSYRMPAYHRLDVGVNFHKEKKWGTRTWSFGAYNAYNRQNPFFMTQSLLYSNSQNIMFLQFRQYSLFPIIPYFSYNFRFK
jgi:outer membrane receptor for ferrienterochelin and colicin